MARGGLLWSLRVRVCVCVQTGELATVHRANITLHGLSVDDPRGSHSELRGSRVEEGLCLVQV